MPYISEKNRKVLDPVINEMHKQLVSLETDDPLNNTEGNLNYIITRMLHMVYGDWDSTRYSHINDAVGVLGCVLLEFYRRVAVPYENQKIYDNGDVKRFQSEPEIVSAVTVEPPERSVGEETQKVFHTHEKSLRTRRSPYEPRGIKELFGVFKRTRNS